MGVYNSNISRGDASALIPEQAVREIFKAAQESSVVGRMARRLQDMARGQLKLNILAALTQVYFVGEAGRSEQTFGERKQTTSARWANKFIHAEEMAAIVPIPKNVIDDVDYDIWGELKPDIASAIGAKMDQAILLGESGVDVPSTWPDGIMLGMPHNHQVAVGEIGDLYDDLLGEDGVFARVESSGYVVDGLIGAINMRAKLRGLRSKIWNGSSMVPDGAPLFVQDMRSAIPYTLDGIQTQFPRNGAIDPTIALMLAGEWQQLVWAVRRDVTFDFFDTGVITDNGTPPVIIHNLMQDDMVALRVTFRMGWELPNPINRVDQNDATRYPFSAYIPLSV